MHILNLEEALDLTSDTIQKNFRKYLSSSYANMQIMLNFDRQFVRAEGSNLWDRSGNKYFDFVAGYGSVNVGHNHPRLIEALRRVENIPKIAQAALQPLPAAFAYNLAQVTPAALTRSFFCNSGAEAIEGALKIAQISTGRTSFVSCLRSFHGKTFGALSISGREKYKKPYEPLLTGCKQVPFGDLDSLEQALQDKTAAAFIVEPIQGEGGVFLPPPGYLTAVRDLCTRYDTLLILDEVQTGLGRTGAMFACNHEDVQPDILCLSKALGGGMVPVGAYITTDDIWKRAYGSFESSLLHSSTFGGYWGNALAAAVGITTLNIVIEEGLAEKAAQNGAYFLKQLQQLRSVHPLIKEVRGKGLMIGLEIADQSDGLLNKLSASVTEKIAGDYGQASSLIAVELLNKFSILTVYTLNNPSVIRLQPPLTVSKDEVDYVVESLDSLFSRRKSFVGTLTASMGGLFSKRRQ